MPSTIICVLLKILVFQAVQGRPKPWIYNGTTPGIKEIILGRCYQYLEIDSKNRENAFSLDVNCDDVWEKFSSSWAGKDPCSVNKTDYKPFFDLIDNHKDITNQTMFWSGTKTIAHDFTHVNTNYATLEDTISGYLADGLFWCGCTEYDDSAKCANGINEEKCDGKCSAERPFWEMASTQFAQKAKGVAFVMLNGTKRGEERAYHSKSFFTNYELPEIGTLQKIEELRIFVIFDLGITPKERCGSGSIENLVADAKRYRIRKILCEDDPRRVKFILCAKYPDAEQCQSKSLHLSRKSRTAIQMI